MDLDLNEVTVAAHYRDIKEHRKQCRRRRGAQRTCDGGTSS